MKLEEKLKLKQKLEWWGVGIAVLALIVVSADTMLTIGYDQALNDAYAVCESKQGSVYAAQDCAIGILLLHNDSYVDSYIARKWHHE
jgi:hypothetical protein